MTAWERVQDRPWRPAPEAAGKALCCAVALGPSRMLAVKARAPLWISHLSKNVEEGGRGKASELDCTRGASRMPEEFPRCLCAAGTSRGGAGKVSGEPRFAVDSLQTLPSYKHYNLTGTMFKGETDLAVGPWDGNG